MSSKLSGYILKINSILDKMEKSGSGLSGTRSLCGLLHDDSTEMQMIYGISLIFHTG